MNTTPMSSGNYTARRLSPQTQHQQQTQLMAVLLLLITLGPPAVAIGTLLVGLARATRQPRALLWVALTGLIGLGVLTLAWPSCWATILTLRDQAQLAIRGLQPVTGSSVPDWPQWNVALGHFWPPLWAYWQMAILLAPLVALTLYSTRVQTADEFERTRLLRAHQALQAAAQAALTRSARAPAAVGNQLVLGVPLSGDLDWIRGTWFHYPAAFLGRHLVLIGGSGTGKTETSIRLAYGAAKVYGWRVFYIDCKGDAEVAARFAAAMRAAGRTAIARCPDEPYDGWRGDPTALLNRLLAVLDYSEPYYRDITKMVLDLALNAPPGPPRSSAALLERMQLDTLLRLYKGRPEAAELSGIRPQDAQAAYNRYRAFFRALNGTVDGGWAFEDMQAGYLLLDGLRLKDQTAGLGRYFLEDFAHFVAARKAPDDRVLLIVDEFPAIAFGGANAATLFEMVRSKGAGIAVTAQSYAGLGQEADRILGAAAGLIIHQCPDPERLLVRAGLDVQFQRRIGFAERGMGAGAKIYATGDGTLAGQEALKVHPNRVKTLPPGECVVIADGCAQHIRVSMLPANGNTAPPPSQPRVAALTPPIGVRPADRHRPNVRTPGRQRSQHSAPPGLRKADQADDSTQGDVLPHDDTIIEY